MILLCNKYAYRTSISRLIDRTADESADTFVPNVPYHRYTTHNICFAKELQDVAGPKSEYSVNTYSVSLISLYYLSLDEFTVLSLKLEIPQSGSLPYITTRDKRE